MLKKTVINLIYFLILLLPWQAVYIYDQRMIAGEKWQYGSLLIYGWELILWLTLILGLIYLIKNVKNKTSGVSIARFRLVGFLWLFMFVCGLSIFFASDIYLAVWSWIKIAELISLSLLILNLDLKLKKIAVVLILGSLFESLLGIFQFLTQQVIANKWLGIAGHLPVELTSFVVDTGSHRWLRAYGTFSHPNILGGFLTLGFLCCLWLYLTNKPNWLKIFSALSLIIISFGLFFSFSRSAWLATAVGLAILIPRLKVENKFKQLIRPLIYLTIVGIFLISLFYPLVKTRLIGQERLEQKSIDQRMDYVEQANNLIEDNFFTGVGLGNYTESLMEKYPDLPVWEYQPVHNVGLLILSEIGIIGLVVFGYFLLLVIWQGRNKALPLACLFSLSVIGFLDHYLWTQLIGLSLLWLVISLNLKQNFSS